MHSVLNQILQLFRMYLKDNKGFCITYSTVEKTVWLVIMKKTQWLIQNICTRSRSKMWLQWECFCFFITFDLRETKCVIFLVTLHVVCNFHKYQKVRRVKNQSHFHFYYAFILILFGNNKFFGLVYEQMFIAIYLVLNQNVSDTRKFAIFNSRFITSVLY